MEHISFDARLRRQCVAPVNCETLAKEWLPPRLSSVYVDNDGATPECLVSGSVFYRLFENVPKIGFSSEPQPEFFEEFRTPSRVRELAFGEMSSRTASMYDRFTHLESLELNVDSGAAFLYRISRPMVHMKTLDIKSFGFGSILGSGRDEWNRLRACLPNLSELKISHFSSVEQFMDRSPMPIRCTRAWDYLFEVFLSLFNVEKLTVEHAQVSPRSICVMIDKMRSGSGGSPGRLKEAVVSSCFFPGDPYFTVEENVLQFEEFNSWVEKSNSDARCTVRASWTGNRRGSSRAWRVLTVHCKYSDDE